MRPTAGARQHSRGSAPQVSGPLTDSGPIPTYTFKVPIERLGESLAFINWTVLTALAIGTFGAVVAGRFRTEATKGYLAFTAFSAAVFAALAWAADTGFPQVNPDGGAQAIENVRRGGLVALAIVAVTYAVALRRGRRAWPLAAAGLLAGILVLVAASLTWWTLSVLVGGMLLFVQLAGLSAALGGVWAAMILGHWYLVTPKLPEAPLVHLARWLTIVLAIQLVLSIAWIGLGAGANGRPGFGVLTELPWALFIWLRLLVGLVFPLVVSWAAIQTAKTRSMESATGLLYINVGTIAAGTILAAGLYFGAGLLV